MKPLASIVIRTLNEERYLDELLTAIDAQDTSVFEIEKVIIDSGSTDATLDIARKHGCRITYIEKADFTFGRSLNMGCAYANGAFLVFISGHCIPCRKDWLEKLATPLINDVDYSYGRQMARDTTKFSEQQLFDKYFPADSRIPQDGFFCNNANAAIRRDVWERWGFDETLTGCEDMHLAKQIVESDGRIGYVADAPVYHIHDESWSRVRIRFEREALALQKIMPEVHISRRDALHFFVVGVLKDFRATIRAGRFWKECKSIVMFRAMQYYGAYCGNHISRQLSEEMKRRYFYPRVSDMNVSTDHRLMLGERRRN